VFTGRVHGREHGCQKMTPVFTGRDGQQCIQHREHGCLFWHPCSWPWTRP